MSDPKCAWCGKLLHSTEGTRTFCCSHCELSYENWTGARFLKRRDAVDRWRVGRFIPPPDEVGYFLERNPGFRR